MLHRIKILGWALLAAALVQSAPAFSLLGPKESWQVAALGYSGDFSESPHNLGEEFRWNVPTNYYTYDQTFLDYFGSNGVYEIDSAVTNLNNIFGQKVSSWSADLSEFPLEAAQINFTAAALHLFDLRSCVFEVILDHIGLAAPQPYIWTLHSRVPTPGCPNFIYAVVKRNFDPVTFQPSVYVNGVLFTYWIEEFCPAIDEAITVPVTVDASANMDTAISTGRIAYNDFTFYGWYYTGITRDDAGGLRYLYQTNNVNIENSGPTGTTTYTTNVAASQLLYTSNLLDLATSAVTNSDATLAGLYPNAVFSSAAASTWVMVGTTNTVAYYTNYPYDPVGTAPHLMLSTNVTWAPQNQFVHYFANLFVPVLVNGVWTNVPVTDITTLKRPAYATVQTVNVATPKYAPYGSGVLATNISSKTFLTNLISGEYFFLPTNACSIVLLQNLWTYTNLTTNVVYSATNSSGAFGGVGGTNTTTTSTNLAITIQNLVTYSTNHLFVSLPITCPVNALSARQGMDHVFQMERRDYDSLIQRYWTPITNTWTAVAVTNNTRYSQTMTRVVTVPDFLFAAADLLVPLPPVNFSVMRTVPYWDTNGIPIDDTFLINGPGTIQPNGVTTFTFSKVGEVYYNIGPSSMDEATAYTDFLWGSFDGTTNAPVVYPVSSSVADYQNQLVLQTFPLALPDAQWGAPYDLNYVNNSSGVSYTDQFSGAGGQAPYTFSLTPGSTMPDGLGLLPDGTITADDLSSPPIPTVISYYQFSIRMTDSAARFIDTPYTLNVTPP